MTLYDLCFQAQEEFTQYEMDLNARSLGSQCSSWSYFWVQRYQDSKSAWITHSKSAWFSSLLLVYYLSLTTLIAASATSCFPFPGSLAVQDPLEYIYSRFCQSQCILIDLQRPFLSWKHRIQHHAPALRLQRTLKIEVTWGPPRQARRQDYYWTFYFL